MLVQAAGELKSGIEAKLAQRAVSEGEGLTARLKQLVSSSSVMLFMKGSPDAPKCGFSAKVGGGGPG